MSLDKLSFASELRQRIAPQKVLFFLKVKDRGLEFPLDGMSINYRRVFVVPGMILAVVGKKEDYLIVQWCGPTLQTEYKGHSEISTYSESVSFTINIANLYLEKGSVVEVLPEEVVKMPNHVPAVLY